MDKKILIVVVLVFVVGVVVGLTVGYFLWKDQVVCEGHYLRVGKDCCLDKNSNLICDRDEDNVPRVTTTVLMSEVAVVTKVVDGDTLVLVGGERVRLLGINAPESGEKCFQEAAERLRELVGGKEIRMEKDIEERDQYGRLLRYVYLGNVLVNEEMVKGGYAHVYLYNNTLRYKDQLMEAEKEAKGAGRCLWRVSLSKCEKCIMVEELEENAPGSDCENLNGEYVVFKNSCDFSCELTGWTVKDEASRTPYEFPDFVLNPGERMRLYTGCGVNTELELYWCSRGRECNAIWNNDGDTLYLRDSTGSLCLEYSY